MKNGDIEIDKNGNKWIWINGAFYIDDMTIEEAKERIININKEDFNILNDIGKIIYGKK
ncbi:hypothetical protein EOM39_04225 [Candidatus Gracilibacteria bacterium]|nr:hypothetical protein [Candidatus Gracilibacteria bacterium]